MTAFMQINTILTFDILQGYQPHQMIYDIPVEIFPFRPSWQRLLDDELFPAIYDICTNYYGKPEHLCKISTCADWQIFHDTTGYTGLNDHSGKWHFGNGRTDCCDWEKSLATRFGFGRDVDASWMNAEEPMEEWLRRLEAQAA